MAEVTERDCAHCGKRFTPKAHAYTRCCSGKCSRLAWYYRNRRVIEFAPRDCPVCGVPLDEDSFPTKVYCSKACRDVVKIVSSHGLSLAEYRERLTSQGNVCAVCGGTAVWEGRSTNRDGWHIDHAHATGKVRGILCPPCNLMLGHAKDDPRVLRAAAAYLEDS